MIDHRLGICAIASVIGHFVLGEALSTLPPRVTPILDRKIEIRVITPEKPEPPPPEPPKPPEPTPEVKPEPKVVHEKPITRTAQATVHDVISKDVPIAEHAVVETAGASSGPPVFGVTMESTSQGGTGPAMPVGNTGTPTTNTAPGPVASKAAAPVAAYEVTKMPLPQGSCSGKYTDEARAASVEGTVILDLIVDEKGRAREIKVVSGLAHGLTEAAIKALGDCRFSPGERDGRPVPVRVRGFKIRFVMQDAQ